MKIGAPLHNHFGFAHTHSMEYQTLLELSICYRWAKRLKTNCVRKVQFVTKFISGNNILFVISVMYTNYKLNHVLSCQLAKPKTRTIFPCLSTGSKEDIMIVYLLNNESFECRGTSDIEIMSTGVLIRGNTTSSALKMKYFSTFLLISISVVIIQAFCSVNK